MSYWIEIICDVRHQGRNTAHNAICLSDRNANPRVLTGNTLAERATGIRIAEGEARAAGWRRGRNGWTCPGCATATGGGKRATPWKQDR